MDCVTSYLSAATPNKWERNCWNLEERAEVQSWEGSQQTQEVGGSEQEMGQGRGEDQQGSARGGQYKRGGAVSDSLCGHHPGSGKLFRGSSHPRASAGVSQSYALPGNPGWGSRWDWLQLGQEDCKMLLAEAEGCLGLTWVPAVS